MLIELEDRVLRIIQEDAGYILVLCLLRKTTT